MSTPDFTDFDKSASDLFEEDFYAGRLDFSLNSRANNGVEFAVEATATHDEKGSVKTSGSLGTSLMCSNHGLSVKETWNVNGLLSSQIRLDKCYLRGLAVEVETTFSPSTVSETTVLASLSLERRRLFALLQSDGGLGARGSLALRFGNVLVGANGIFNAIIRRRSEGTIGVAYEGSDFTVCGRLKNGTQCTASVFHRISPDLQWGVLCGWSFQSPSTHMAIALRHQIDKTSFWKGKLDDQARVCLSYGQKMSDNVQATVSANFDCKAGGNFTDHRFGLGLEFKA